MNFWAYLSKPFFALAPMADVTDAAFRRIIAKYGKPDVTWTEFVSADGLCHPKGREKLLKDLEYSEVERPIVAQLFSSNPDNMRTACKLCAELGFDGIDINMGCPAKKINRRLAGSALLQDPALVREILQTVVAAVDVPVTLKIRTGWDTEHRNGVEIAEIAESCGVQALTVHGRTRACLFNGQAEYDTIRAIKRHVSIPVVANGDIDTPQKALAVLEYTGADAIMIGRAAIGYPWIFREIKYFFETGNLMAAPSISERVAAIRIHLQKSMEWKGGKLGILEMRRHYTNYLKGLPGIKEYRNLLVTIADYDAINELLVEIEKKYADFEFAPRVVNMDAMAYSCG